MDEIAVAKTHSPQLLKAKTDREVIDFYLGQTDDQALPVFSPRTLESYRRDIKRLLVFLDGRPLNSVTIEDTQAFTAWLASPPADLISNSCRRPINHPEWQPFYKSGLSPTSLRQQLASVKAFYRWLLNVGYIQQNAFGLMKSAKQSKSTTSRHLYKEDLLAVRDYLNSPGAALCGKELRRHARQRWLWFAYLFSGLRISELITHTTGQIYCEVVNGEKVWMIAVTGKGRRDADNAPLPDQFIRELWLYREKLGLEPWPGDDQPLLLSLSGKSGITSRTSIHNEFKQLIKHAGVFQETQGNYDSAARLRHASTHWLRHSFVTTLLDISGDIPAVSQLARHRDINTTIGYDKTELLPLRNMLNEFVGEISGS